MVIRVVVFIVLSCVWSLQSIAAEPVSRKQYDTWMEEISNWGRWGKDDELGTLNLLTPEVRKAAVAEVQSGQTISLSLKVNKQKDPLNANPLEHALATTQFGGHHVAGDRYSIDYHGFAHSHMDGLPHFAWRGKMYNGVPFDSLTPSGAIRLGIDHPAAQGVVARGVLLVRTGRWPAVASLGQWNFLEKAAGMHASVARWLKARDVVAIGCDGVSDVMS